MCEDADTRDSLATASLAELDRKLNNPLTSIWPLTFPNNTFLRSGDALDGDEYSNTLFFQPFMPFEVGANKQTMFTLRPVFPIVTKLEFVTNPRESSEYSTGFDDFQLLTLADPSRGEGLVWGLGATFIFPTASDN